MSRPNPFAMTVIFLLFLAGFGGLPLLTGGLFLDTHEGDTYHLLDILLRLERGLVPHLDFPTPLGIVAFLPFQLFMELGESAGRAIMLGQLMVGAILLPLVVYAAVTRMSRIVGYFFGLVTLGLSVALSFGGSTAMATISMHYNRWGWAIGFLALALAFLPSRGAERPRFDGAIIGICGAVLALLKITYFVALAPAVFVAVVYRWKRPGVLAAAAGGIAVALIATVFYGLPFWGAYLGDLATVTRSEVRPFVGVPLNDVLAGPRFLGFTVLAVAGALMVRRAGEEVLGSAMLLLAPGFIYITYQNFGNDPQWVWMLAILLFALRPVAGAAQVGGTDLRMVMSTAAWIALALNFPSLVVNASSTVEHAAFDKSRFVEMLPEDMGHDDVFIRLDRAYSMTAQTHEDREAGPWAKYEAVVERPQLSEIGGVTIPHCEWMAGSRGYFETFTAAMLDAGVPEGAQIFTADILTAFWMFGPFAPLEGGAPWYYGDVAGLQNADYVMVPKCSFIARVRGIMIEDVIASGIELNLIRDDELMALFAAR